MHGAIRVHGPKLFKEVTSVALSVSLLDPPNRKPEHPVSNPKSP